MGNAGISVVGSTFRVGGFRANSYTEAPVFTPEESWNVDTKLDDGKPYTGQVFSGDTTDNPACRDVDTEDAVYELTDTSKACALSMTMFGGRK